METIVSDIFTSADVLLLVLGLNAIGFVAKRIPQLPNAWIPPILFVSGVLGYQGLVEQFSVRNTLIGTVAAAAAIGGHRMIKDWLESRQPQTNETNPNASGTAGPNG